jgi:hypothetical protein
MIRCPFERDELVLEPICEEVVSAPQRDDRFAGEEVEAEEIDSIGARIVASGENERSSTTSEAGSTSGQ